MTIDDQLRAGTSRVKPAGTSLFRWPQAASFLVVLCLLALGVANVVARATWHEVEDGVLWVSRTQGVTAAEIAASSPAARVGIHVGDVLLAINGNPVDAPADVAGVAHGAEAGTVLSYTLLRLGSRQIVQVALSPIPQGNSVLYFVLAAVGIFTLLVGVFVRVKRPGDPATWHFLWMSVAFFGVFTFSFSGRLDALDWVFYWADVVAGLMLPPLFLHLAVAFPERTGGWFDRAPGSRLLPLIYLPALLLGAARVMSIARLEVDPRLLNVVAALDRAEPLYFALCLAAGIAVLLRARGQIRSVTARRQLRWILWGTVLGGGPCTLGYALPFALGFDTSVRMELLAIPLGIVPLAFASAIVRYRLMDVEVIVKRSLVYVAAASAIVAAYAILYRVVGGVLLENRSQHNTVIAGLATLVMVLLARPVKDAIQNILDRAFYRDRYDYRRALVGFARDLSTDLDPSRLSERLVARVTETLVTDRMALLLTDEAGGAYRAIRSKGFVGEPPSLSIASGVGARLMAGHTVILEDPTTLRRVAPEEVEFWRDQGVHAFIPCPSKQRTIAVMAIGRKESGEALSSEDMSLLVAVAAQVATALENGRLYQQLKRQADEVEGMRQFNENILESLDAGLMVIDGSDRIVRWNRALESLCDLPRIEAVGRRIDEVFGADLLDRLRTVRRDTASGTTLYRVPIGATRARADKGLLVNVAVVPLAMAQAGLGPASGWIVLFENVTARVELEEQLQIADKMASIGVLAAGVAHEVNTPLTGISSYTQMLLEQADPDHPNTKLLEKIERQTFRAAKIVNGLLTLARSGAQPTNEPGSVDINAVVSDVLSLLEHQLKAGNVQTRRELASSSPVVRGFEQKLQQVFLNLILNARDAMPKGGWLSISTRTEGDRAVIELGDTGAGISAEHLSRIYDPFFTTKAIGQGTGLGLSITYGIVREHDGTITCDSTVGEGTRFVLTLPLVSSGQRAGAAGG